jgi:signal peptidase
MSRKQTIQKLYNTIYRIISTSVIALAAILVILNLCGIRMYNVRSGSMEDSIPLGSLCFVSTYSSYDDIKVNDVISFHIDDMKVTHRVAEITSEGFVTKGDNNQNADPEPVTESNYIGKTVFAVPAIGAFLGKLRSLGGIVFSGVVLALFLAGGHFYKKT